MAKAKKSKSTKSPKARSTSVADEAPEEVSAEIDAASEEQEQLELDAHEDLIHDEQPASKSANHDDEEADAGLNADVDTDHDEAEPFPNYQNASDDENSADRKKVHIEFPYSQIIREKVPKVFEMAETVADEWVNDGNFENVPVGHPLAQITVAAGLRKAKEVEKKLEEKGVFAMAKMGLEYAKSQLNDKLKKK